MTRSQRLMYPVAVVSACVLLALPIVGFRHGHGGSGPDAPAPVDLHALTAPLPAGTLPGPGTVGTRGILQPHGSMVITQPGLYSDLSIDGHVDVWSAGVVLRNMRITGRDAHWAVRNFTDHTVVLADCDLGPDTPSGGLDAALVYSHYAIYRSSVHGSNDGLKANGDVIVQDDWIHDLHTSAGAHPDGIQISNGSHVVVRHDRIDADAYDDTGRHGSAVSAVNVKADLGPVSQVTIADNRLSGFVGYLVYVRRSKYGIPSGVEIIGNTLGPRESRRDAGDGFTAGFASLSDVATVRWLDNRDPDGKPVTPSPVS
jgi:hypothetical protein